jgi:succinate dehydrogenase/fumarate reductase flavoprotein subunit
VLTNTGEWSEITDVVVVGSGAAALTAATLAADGGAEVVVFEKTDALGGTSGASGGGMWVPNNHHLAPAGLEDSPADAIRYITRVADGRALDPHLIEVFVDTAPEMLAYLEARTPLRTQPVTNLHDYYEVIRGRVPGCKDFSRTVEACAFPAREALGEWADRIAARSTLLSLGASTTLQEDLSSRGGISANLDELARREREGIRVKGAALVSALVAGLLERGVQLRTSSPAEELVTSPDGSVVGVRAVAPDGDHRIGARRGVILACGGFEWNREMVLAYFGYDIKPLSPGGNTGDGHLMAMEATAQMGNMWSYWGNGAAFDPSVLGPDGKPFPQMLKGLGPGSVIVNRHGHRFMHGGYTYNDFPKTFGAFDQKYVGYPNTPPAWVIFGRTVKERSQILTVRPGDPAPDWIAQADSVRLLAEKIGLDPDELDATVFRYNEHAEKGEDPEFQPARSRAGSPLPETPEPVVGPPYYAIQQWPASLGTNGGCRINENGQVLGTRRPVIEGLYAAGNTSAAVLGGAYVGGGTPIACGMTFGYRAGRHAAAQPSREI